MSDIGVNVFGLRSRFWLENRPVPSTLEVVIDGLPAPATRPSGQVIWSYDPPTNSVIFAPLSTPAVGAELVFRYQTERH